MCNTSFEDLDQDIFMNRTRVVVMRTVVLDCPQALTDPALMSERLMRSEIAALAEKRLMSCMRRLQRELGVDVMQ